MNKDKNEVFNNYFEMIKNSWTYNKLTNEEKEKLKDILTDSRILTDIKGSYNQRWSALNCIYFTFLKMLDYNPLNWRE